MRKVFRIFLLVVFTSVSLTPVVLADHLVADCPLSLIGETAPSSQFGRSPHGAFRNGSVIYVLRGQTLTTLNSTDLGDLQVARQDLITSLAGRESTGGAAYSNGFLYVSSEAGLEIYDLRNVRGGAGGNAPISVTRIPGRHYRRLAVQGNVLVGLYPASDLPCHPTGAPACRTVIDVYSITDITSPARVAQIFANTTTIGFEDIAFANGFLYATGPGGTFAYNLTNPGVPTIALQDPTRGTFLVSNGTTFLGVGQENLIGVFTIGPAALMNYFAVFTLPSIFDRSHDLMFHPEAWFDGTHLITMIDERDPATGGSARTIAFDVFDFTVPLYEGSDDRIYENVTFTYPDERKYDPIAVGPFIHVIGEVSGAQVWGVCGQMAGRIELDTVGGLACGGSELRGFVTGANKITTVELFLDGTSLGIATIGAERLGTGSQTAVFGWRVGVNLDQTPRGSHLVRAVATDSLGNRRQIASQNVFFPGPGGNCTSRKRGTKR